MTRKPLAAIRFCVVCEKEIERGPNDSPAMYKARATCGDPCKRELRRRGSARVNAARIEWLGRMAGSAKRQNRRNVLAGIIKRLREKRGLQSQ